MEKKEINSSKWLQLGDTMSLILLNVYEPVSPPNKTLVVEYVGNQTDFRDHNIVCFIALHGHRRQVEHYWVRGLF